MILRYPNFLKSLSDDDFLNEAGFKHISFPERDYIRRFFVWNGIPCMAPFATALRKLVPDVSERLGVALSDTIEGSAHRYANGDFGDYHVDGLKYTYRAVSWVYYRRLGEFTGGDLVLFDEQRREIDRQTPEDNLLVFFIGKKFLHCVEPVRSDDAWQNARFSLIGWIAEPGAELHDQYVERRDGEIISKAHPRYFYRRA